MRRELKHEIAEHLAGDIAKTYGLVSSELFVIRAVLGFLDSEPHADYIINRAMQDIAEAIGVNTAPWDDEDWFKGESA